MDYMGVIAQMVMADIESEEPSSGTDTVETLLVNAEPGAGDKQLKDYYEKHREAGLQKKQNPPRGRGDFKYYLAGIIYDF